MLAGMLCCLCPSSGGVLVDREDFPRAVQGSQRRSNALPRHLLLRGRVVKADGALSYSTGAR